MKLFSLSNFSVLIYHDFHDSSSVSVISGILFSKTGFFSSYCLKAHDSLWAITWVDMKHIWSSVFSVMKVCANYEISFTDNELFHDYVRTSHVIDTSAPC